MSMRLINCHPLYGGDYTAATLPRLNLNYPDGRGSQVAYFFFPRKGKIFSPFSEKKINIQILLKISYVCLGKEDPLYFTLYDPLGDVFTK